MLVASADNPLLCLPERADVHETRLWAQAECSMLAFCLAWATRAMRERERREIAGPLHGGERDSTLPLLMAPEHGRVAGSRAAPASSCSNGRFSAGISTRARPWRIPCAKRDLMMMMI
jgi:hypothetical protein